MIILEKFIDLIVNSPLYPHWLEQRKCYEANKHLLKRIHGKVIEVGAGDGSLKNEVLKTHKKIKEYIATDFSSWNEEFDNIDNKINKLGIISKIWGYKKRIKLDKVCNAEKLPYPKDFFDYHLSFEVLEHIGNPNKYFEEATRVVKKNGRILVAVPFLYRMHGGETDHKLDYFRYTNGFFYQIAKQNNLKLIRIYNNTGFGTTLASLTNQWIIQKIKDSKIIIKTFLILLSPIIFLSTNIVGLLIDQQPDRRFATRFYVIFEK